MKRFLALLLVTMPVFAFAQVSPVTITPAKLSRYINNGTTLSFVASGVSALDDCASLLEFREARNGSVQILEILCTEGEEARFARLTFIRVSDERGRISLSPFRMEFLP
jgi:hypothetical protein